MKKMVENKDISRILADHEKRIASLEKRLDTGKKPKVNSDVKTLPEHIIELRDDGFFSQPKTAEETHSKLSMKYSCKLNRVAVALVRLAGKRQLRKASKTVNGKEYQAYVW